MPGTPPPSATEVRCLIGSLGQQRDGLRYAAFGLDEEQTRATPTTSALSIGGLIKHYARVERQWLNLIRDGSSDDSVDDSVDDYVSGFSLTPTETLESITSDLLATGAETDRFLATADLGAPVLLPPAPWMPSGDGYTVRWVVLHVIEEGARHAGHADIIRESIDGATMYPLMAGAEGWPETDWIKPWKPASGTGGSG